MISQGLLTCESAKAGIERATDIKLVLIIEESAKNLEILFGVQSVKKSFGYIARLDPANLHVHELEEIPKLASHNYVCVLYGTSFHENYGCATL